MIAQKTNTKAELLSSMFQFQSGIFKNATEDLSESLAVKRPSDRSNHTNWLLGHLLHCRYMLANMIGVDAENPLGDIFWKAIENKDYPPVKEIITHFPEISDKLIDKLSRISDEEMDAKPAADKPCLTDMVSFFVYHEAYHLGQIGYVRKIIGLEPLKSN